MLTDQITIKEDELLKATQTAKQELQAANLKVATENQERLKNSKLPFGSATLYLAEQQQPQQPKSQAAGSFQPSPLKTRSDALEVRDPEVLQKAVVFWLTNTRVTANRSDVCVRDGKCYPSHYCDDSDEQMYDKFIQSDDSLLCDGQLRVRGYSDNVTMSDITNSINENFGGGIAMHTQKGGPKYAYTTVRGDGAVQQADAVQRVLSGKRTLTMKITQGAGRGEDVEVVQKAKIGKSRFRQLKPFFIKPETSSTCVCPVCADMSLWLDGLLTFSKWHTCGPRIHELITHLKETAQPFAPRPVNLLEMFLCAQDEGGQFRIECCRGNCKECGWVRYFGGEEVEIKDTIPVVETDGQEIKTTDKPIFVKHDTYVKRMVEVAAQKNGSDEAVYVSKKTRAGLETQTTLPSDFDIAQFKAQLLTYQLHFAIAVHQAKNAKLVHEMIRDVDQEECIGLDMDFSENYEVIHKIGIQSEHWGKKQVTLFIAITHHREKTGFGSKLVSEAHVFISPDSLHDTYFVQAAMDKLQDVFKQRGKQFDRWFINTDGASQHFKSKETMYSLRVFLKKSGAVSVMWENCAPGHGKGPWDGIGAVIKTIIRTLEKQSKLYAHNPLDVFVALKKQFLGWQKNLSEQYSIENFHFYYVCSGDVEEKEALKKLDKNELKDVIAPIKRPKAGEVVAISKLKGIRKKYFCFLVRRNLNEEAQPPIPENICIIQCRFLSCRCKTCKSHEYDKCQKSKFDPAVRLAKQTTSAAIGTRPKAQQNKDAESRVRRKVLAVALCDKR